MTNDDKDLKTIVKRREQEKQEGIYFLLNELEQIFAQRNPRGSARSAINNFLRSYTRSTPQQPSEPLKELDRESLCKFLENWREQFRDWIPAKDVDRLCNLPAKTLSDAICSKFGQPSEKKALSVEEIEDVIAKYSLQTLTGKLTVEIAQAIHSALPAQREVRYPEKKVFQKHDCPHRDTENKAIGWNNCIDEFKKLNGG